MNVRVLYFAGLRDAVGRSEDRLALPESVRTVADLSAFLSSRQDLQGRMSSIRIAVNETFAAPADPLAEGDVIALIPPVSGG